MLESYSVMKAKDFKKVKTLFFLTLEMNSSKVSVYNSYNTK